ncbi:MerR family transcriptional regulator [Streptomyces sp. NPDC006645]|uniref:MerR family transcriptional regulator n=1 Tax=unclassified Streptomyces TaxID=2593676 RepID=UPI0033B72A46
MRIGAFSRRTGISQRLLRYYEEQGLLHPLRRPSGYREYAEEDVRAVQSIRMLLAAGLSTRTIAGLLPCMVNDGQGPVPGCAGLLPDLQRERERIDRAVADLLAAGTALDAVMAATPEAAAPETAVTLESMTTAAVGENKDDHNHDHDPDACFAAAPGGTVTR